MKNWYRTIFLLLACLHIVSNALRFYVPSNEKKCLKEEIHRNVVLTGEYELSEAVGSTASVHVGWSRLWTCLFVLFRLLTPGDILCTNARTFPIPKANSPSLPTNTTSCKLFKHALSCTLFVPCNQQWHRVDRRYSFVIETLATTPSPTWALSLTEFDHCPVAY